MKQSIMKHIAGWMALSALPLMLLTGCSDDYATDTNGRNNSAQMRISLAGQIDQVALTRVNDDGFANGDVIGVYVVDYEGNNPGTLKNSGNRGNNVRYTYDEAAGKWNAAYDLYWKDKKTSIDIYGYYPWGEPTEVTAYEFEVRKDQSTVAADGELGGYEASDFLWAKAANVAPTESVIRLPMKHRMSSAKVVLTEGTGFEEGAWSQLAKQVLLKNVKRSATINLQTGDVTATGEVSAAGVIPYQKSGEFRAIVVPQQVAAETPLFSLTVDGEAYTFTKSEAFTYVAGKMHTFTIRVDYKGETGDYTFTLAGESITAWENDDVSHDATMKEYVVIHSKAGQLKEAILEAGKDYKKLKNLKITGRINTQDFEFMRDEMDNLQALNLKNVRTIGHRGLLQWERDRFDDEERLDVITQRALDTKETLTRLVLPDTLWAIGERAFRQCTNLTGSVIIPEGVESIGASAFLWCNALTGSLSLPSTLKYIGGGGAVDIHGAFLGCRFNSELILPEKLEYIGHNAFGDNPNYYGNLRLPKNLTYIGDFAFVNDNNLTGDLEIPQGVLFVNQGAFGGCSFNGNLTLHQGLIAIGDGAFSGCSLKGELHLPEGLTKVGESAFNSCDFSGELKIPSSLVSIGRHAFAYNWRLMGTLEFPEGIESIGAGAFANCRSIEKLIFPESLESIGAEPSWNEDGGAFQNCYGISSIICKGSVPPHVQNRAFDGVPKDNFTLEVPESSIVHYQTATGWMDFKRIAAHHELVCRPATANAINTEHKQTLVLNAEGDWEVESQPDWCTLSQTNGSQKTELTLTIHAMAKGAPQRQGEIVFKLKDKDYRHKCTVTQYDYAYAEDEIITKQTATKGNRGGINLVFLGDGFDGKDISEGKYMEAMEMQIENFFGIEPFKSYRNYFNVHTAIALAPETGIGTINTIRYSRFGTTFTGGVGLKCDYDAVFDYALRIPQVTEENLKETLIIIVPNSTDYGGICQMWADGSAIAFCPMSTYGYPLDTRGVIQHEAGGHGFGKLGDEYIYHNAFIDFCGCSCCGHVMELESYFSLGWFENLSLTGKMHEVPWSHLIFDSRYSDIVDIFEGGYMHTRGVFRSEQNSCMNNDIPYYSTISRESIVKRIKRYAGEVYSYEEFVANDKREAGAITRTLDVQVSGRQVHSFQHPPVLHKGSPLKR